MARAQQMVVVAADTITLLSYVSSIIKSCLGVITFFFFSLCFCLGPASLATTERSGKLTEFMSNLAWDFAIKEGFRVFKEMPQNQ